MVTKLLIDEAGRIELTAELRKRLQVSSGDSINLKELDDGTFILVPRYDIRDLFGILDNNGIHLTVEQMNEIIQNRGISD